MNSFTHLKRGDCPICNGARKDCRKNNQNNLIHCRDDSATSVTGYRFVKQDALGFNLWAVDDGHDHNWSSERREEWQRQQETRRQQQEIEDARRRAKLLSIEERDRQYRTLNRQLTLSNKHRQVLGDRGLTDADVDFAVELGAVRTWNPGQRITGVSPDLAGVNPSTRQLTSVDGIALYAFDAEGRITGAQVKTDNDLFGKYVWISSATKGGNSPHLPSGELPLFCWKHPNTTTIAEVWLCEGALKSMLVAFQLWRQGRYDVAVIGTASAARYGEQTLKGYLEQLGAQTIRLMPDAGAVVNPTIHKANQQTLEWCQQWGYKVTVGWWNQVDKSQPDIDELDSFDAITYLSLNEFFELVDKSRYQQEVAKAQERLNTLTCKPDILLHEEYLPSELWSKLPTAGILNIKARKGGGKSAVIKQLIKCYKAQGRKVLSITPRIALGREQAFKWDITWIDECGVQGNYSLSVGMLGQEEALGLCWDSLWKITGKNWEGAVVVIDESELGFKHIATSSTCAERRSFIMVGFAQLLNKVLATGGLVILSDADLTDVSVDYVRAFAPKDTPIFTVINTHTGMPWDVDLFLGKRGTAEDLILDNLAAGLKTAVPTDSQYEAEALERRIIEHHPAAKIIRVDRKTCQEDLGREFVKDPNRSIESLQPDVLIYTPSMGTGVSIDVEYFDAVVGLFFAVIEPTEACQMMARVRDATIPRSAWCKDANHDSSGCKSPLPEIVKKQLFKFHNSTSDLLGLASALSGSEDDGAALDALNRLWDKEKQEWKSPHIDLYANVKARRNFGLSQFAPQFRQRLIDDGHDVSVFEGTKTAFSEEITDAKEKIKQEQAKAIADSEEIDIEKARAILSNPNSKEKERQEAHRAVLADNLPGVELTQEFVYKAAIADKGRWLSQHRLFWLLTNSDKAKILDTKQWRWHLAKAHVFLPDIHTQSLQIKVLEEVGILDLIKPESEFCAKDKSVKHFLDRALFMKYKIKTAFNLTVTAKTEPITLLKRLLQRIGLELIGTKREGSREDRARYYKIDQATFDDPDRLSILQALTQKYADLYDQSSKQESGTCTTNNSALTKNFGVHDSPIAYINSRVVDTGIEALEPLLNIEISQPLATEIEINAGSAVVPVTPEVVPISWGVGLIRAGSIVQCLGRAGYWTVKTCCGVAAKIFDRYGDEEYVSCEQLRLVEVAA